MKPKKIVTQQAAGPPETTDEVMVWLRQPGLINATKHIIGSDMGTGLNKAWKTLGLCSARACHSKDEYTPVCTLKTKDLPKQALKVLKKNKRARVGPRLTKHASILKKCLRRLGLLGRSARSKGHIDGLAAEFLTRQTGLEAIVQAFACYRHRYEDKVQPKELFSQTDFLLPG